MPTAYKPSPLGYGSPRSSPFRRPESPVSPSPLRQTTPSASPTKTGPSASTARFANNSPAVASNGSWTPRGNTGGGESPLAARGTSRTTATKSNAAMANGNALSQLQPSQVRTLREGFQILDRDSDGSVGRDDVADMLNQLGQFISPSQRESRAFVNGLQDYHPPHRTSRSSSPLRHHRRSTWARSSTQ